MGGSFFRGSPMSRGQATVPIRRGAPTSPIAGIGSVISDMVATAMYDPAKDPRIQQAKLYGAKTEREKFDLAEAQQAAERATQARKVIAGVTDAMGLSDAAPALAAADYGTDNDTRGAGDIAQVLANLIGPSGGFGTDQTDAAFRAGGGRPDQTREALGYDVDKRTEAQFYDADKRASAAVDVAGLVEVPGMGPDGKPVFTNRAGLADGNATGVQPMVSETDARGSAFRALSAPSQAQAVGPTKDEVAGSVAAEDAPTMSTSERRAFVGAEPKIDGRAPMNYVVPGADGNVMAQGRTLDGRTDATTGEPLPQNAQIVKREATGTADDVITKNQRGNLELEVVGYEDFKGLLDQARQVGQSDPTLFGTTGNIRRLAQGMTSQMANIGLLSGDAETDMNAAYQDAYARMASNGVDMTLFGPYDPNLDDITKLSTLLTYGAASVLAGQEGRSVSDRDVKVFRQVVGDPASWLGTQQSFLSGIDLMERILAQRAGNREGLRGGRSAGTPAANAPAVDDPEIDALLRKYGG